MIESVAEKFISQLKTCAEHWQPVDGVSERIVANAHSLINDAAEKGAEFIVGGPKYLRPSALQPTIVTNVTKTMSIYDTESFGPSVSLYTAKTEEEAIELANSTSYGLSAAVHSQDWGRALRMARQIECGTIWVNGLTVGDTGKHQPFLSALPTRKWISAELPYT